MFRHKAFCTGTQLKVPALVHRRWHGGDGVHKAESNLNEKESELEEEAEEEVA